MLFGNVFQQLYNVVDSIIIAAGDSNNITDWTSVLSDVLLINNGFNDTIKSFDAFLVDLRTQIQNNFHQLVRRVHEQHRGDPISGYWMVKRVLLLRDLILVN